MALPLAALVGLAACGAQGGTPADGTGTPGAPASVPSQEAGGPDAAAAAPTGGRWDGGCRVSCDDPPSPGPVVCPTAVVSRPLGTRYSALPAITWWGAGYTAVYDENIDEATGVFTLFAEKTDASGQTVAGPVPILPGDTESS